MNKSIHTIQQSLCMYQAALQHGSLEQKSLFTVFHGSVAWLLSVQWFLCSVWYHLGLLRSFEGSTALEGTRQFTHMEAMDAECYLGAQLVLLTQSLTSAWVSPWDAEFPQLDSKRKHCKHPKAQTASHLSLCLRRYTASLPPHFMGEVTKSLWPSNPPQCVFHLYTYTYIYVYIYIQTYIHACGYIDIYIYKISGMMCKNLFIILASIEILQPYHKHMMFFNLKNKAKIFLRKPNPFIKSKK